MPDTDHAEPVTDALTFRRVEPDDLPLLQRWLNTPHVLEWWKEPLSLEETERKYLPCIEGREPTEPFLVLLDGRPVGYVQSYRIRDYPEYERALALDEEAAGVDLYLAERDLLYGGLGTRLLLRFLAEYVFPTYGVASCVIGPQEANRAAIRCYEKVGFRYLKTVSVPGEDAPEYVMWLPAPGASEKARGEYEKGG